VAVLHKLMEARVRLHSMELKKSGRNGFSGHVYFELGDFITPTLKIFSDIGLAGVVSYTSELATLTITDTEAGDSVTITSPMGSAALKGCHEVQNIGAVETFQRRYLWVTAMEIVEHDALDSGKVEVEDEKPRIISKKQRDDVLKLLEETGSDVKVFCQFYDIENVAAMPIDKFRRVMNTLQKKKADQQKAAKQNGGQDNG